MYHLSPAARRKTGLPRELIIDTDPGADDVVALLFALASPEALNQRAITTVAGNVRLDKTTRNACLAR
jgi:purine nucleosidase